MAIDFNSADKPACGAAQEDGYIVHQQQIAAYNVWAEQRSTFSAEVWAWRESLETGHSA